MNENMDVILRGRKSRKLFDQAFSGIRKKYDLRQIEIEILLYLNKHPGSSSSDICRNLNINKGHVSQAVYHLCHKGFLNAKQDENDRRYVSFSITDLGQTLIKESGQLRETVIKQLFAGISEEELEILRKICEKISENIDHFQID